jgi:AraC-like DNA-binding protein
MIAASVLQREVLGVLNTTLLPWLSAERAPRLVLAELPLVAPPGVSISLHRTPPLRKQGKAESSNQNRFWKKQALNSINIPTLLFVVTGEADFRIGTTTDMVAGDPRLARHSGIYTLALPGVSCLLLPPGVPFSDSSRPHWERPQLERARSHVLWLRILPEAAFCHTCKTAGHQHTSGSCLFIADGSLMSLAELLFEEMRSRERHFSTSAQCLLRLLLLRVERNLASRPPMLARDGQAAPGDAAALTLSSPTTMALERACRHINCNLGKPLSPAIIASQAYVSLSQLKRIFHSEMKMSIMQYVYRRRIEAAQYLLKSTDMPIREVAAHTGHGDLSHFSASFSRAVGQSPSAFRKAAHAKA